jgi:hypothetical protein
MSPNLDSGPPRRNIVIAAGVAAVLAVAVGSYALGRTRTRTVAASGRIAADAGATGPSGSAPSPTGSAAPAPTTRPASGPGGATPTGSRTAAEFAGVQLSLPPGWRLDVISGFGSLQQGCVVSGSSHPDPGRARPQDCTIVVRSFRGFPPAEGSTDAPYFFADADAIGGYADDPGPSCSGGDVRFTQPVHHSVTVDGRAGEYRSVVFDCTSGADFAVQQWAFTDEPNVALTSYTPPGSPLRAVVGTIVTGATLLAGSGTRTTDFGLLTSYRAGAGGSATVTLDREVAASPFTGDTDANDNPKTYPLQLAPDVLIRSAITLCPTDAGLTANPHGLGIRPCTLAQLQATLSSGSPGPVWIRYDAQGRVAAIVETYRE